MDMVRRTDDDRVKFLLLEHLAEVGVFRRLREPFKGLTGPAVVRIANRLDILGRDAAEIRRPLSPGADDSNIQFFVGRLRGGVGRSGSNEQSASDGPQAGKHPGSDEFTARNTARHGNLSCDDW